MEFKGKKVLVAFFSHKGENYSKGHMVNLKEWNTSKASKIVASIVDSDLFEIRTVKEYSSKYRDCVNESVEDLKNDAYPELKEDKDISDYDVIILGYPCWCGTMPRGVFTFLTKHDFTNKIILPFCTNEGSGLGKSEADIKRLCPNAIIKPGLSINGTEVESSRPLIESWLKN